MARLVVILAEPQESTPEDQQDGNHDRNQGPADVTSGTGRVGIQRGVAEKMLEKRKFKSGREAKPQP